MYIYICTVYGVSSSTIPLHIEVISLEASTLEVAHAMLAAKSFCQPFVVRVGYQGVGDYIMNPFEEFTRMSLDSLHVFLQMKSENF